MVIDGECWRTLAKIWKDTAWNRTELSSTAASVFKTSDCNAFRILSTFDGLAKFDLSHIILYE